MGQNRMVRVNELLRREIAEDLYRIMNEKDFDLSSVTLTRVDTSNDLRRARVLISVRGNAEHQHDTLHTIRNHRKEIQSRINKNVTLKYTPQLHFELDHSIEAGDHVLHILSELEDSDQHAEDTP